MSALDGAYRKGAEAFRADKPCHAPYKDRRTYHGAVTWSRAFIRAWEDGWNEAKKESKNV